MICSLPGAGSQASLAELPGTCKLMGNKRYYHYNAAELVPQPETQVVQAPPHSLTARNCRRVGRALRWTIDSRVTGIGNSINTDSPTYTVSIVHMT